MSPVRPELDLHVAVGGVEVDVAGVAAPGVLVGRVNGAGGGKDCQGQDEGGEDCEG